MKLLHGTFHSRHIKAPICSDRILGFMYFVILSFVILSNTPECFSLTGCQHFFSWEGNRLQSWGVFFLFLKYLASWLWTYSTYWVMSAALRGRNLLNYRVNVRKRTVFFFSLFQIIYCCVQWLYMWQYCTWKWHCIHSNIVSCNRTSTFNVI